MQGFRLRALVGALYRPDAGYYWARSKFRLLDNQREDPDYFKPVVEPDSIKDVFLRRLSFKVCEIAPELPQVGQLYDHAKRRVYDLYGYKGTGRLPSIISQFDAVVLYVIARLAKPRVIVETGVSDGMSTLIFLTAIQANRIGVLHSIDFPVMGVPRLYGRPPGWLIPDAIRTGWRLHLGESRRMLPGILKDSPPIDLFFHDSEHSLKNMRWEFGIACEHSSQGGFIISDDSQCNSAFRELTLSPKVNPQSALVTCDGLGVVRLV